MKHNILILTAALALGFASCESDYLETLPNDAISMTTAFSTTEACANAVNGIAKRMTTQYLGSQGMNGEGTMKNWYNNFNSQNARSATRPAGARCGTTSPPFTRARLPSTPTIHGTTTICSSATPTR